MHTSKSLPAGPDGADLSPVTADHFPARMSRADWAFRLRRMRDRIFGSELFGEPVWDVLLYVAAAQERGEPVTVGRLALDIHLPREVLARTLTALRQANLLVFEIADANNLAAPVSLSDEGHGKLQSVLG